MTSVAYTPNSINVSQWYTLPVEMDITIDTVEDIIVIYFNDSYSNAYAYGDFTDGVHLGTAETFNVYSGVGVYSGVWATQGDIEQCMISKSYCISVGTDLGTIFNVTNPTASTELFHTRNLAGEISTSPSDLVASVGVVSMGVYGSVYPYMILVIGIGVAFYILQRLLEVMPKDKKSKIKKYDIIGESSAGVVHTTFRERKKDL